MRMRRARRASPRTVVGRWLLATATGDTNTRMQVAGRLNGGRPGMNDDEPAVVSCACHLGLVTLQDQRGASAPWELVDVMLRNPPEPNRPSRADTGATASTSLVEPIAKVPGLDQG